MAVPSVVTTAHEAFSVNTPEDAALPALRVVALGGGTGLPTVLRGLRAGLFDSHPWDPARDPTRLTAIATVADDGGSSGKLRATYRLSSPGDVRNCLLALAGSGRYAEAIEVFEETLRFGREYRIGPFLARGVAVSVGFHLDVFDLAGHERVAQEARELAGSLRFPPALASTGIDLLLNFARSGEPGRVEGLIDEVSAAAASTGSWHGWQWRVRLGEARAELALARGEWDW